MMPPLRSFDDLNGKERGQKKTDDLRAMTTLGPRTLLYYYINTTTSATTTATTIITTTNITTITRERSGSVVECLTRDRGAAGSSLTGVTALWSLSKTHLF